MRRAIGPWSVCVLFWVSGGCGMPAPDPPQRAAAGKADTADPAPGLEGLDLSPYDGLVFVGPAGNVSIQSQHGDDWVDLKTQLIDGRNAERFTVRGDVLHYAKGESLHPVAVATGQKMEVSPNALHSTGEHDVFQVDVTFAAKILYDEIGHQPFIWVLDAQDTLDQLPIIEAWYSDGCNDPVADSLEFHYGVQTRRRIIAQLNALDEPGADWSFNLLPEGPLFRDYPRENEVVSFEAEVIIPQVPLDREVLRYGPDAGFRDSHVAWLARHGFVTVQQVGLSDFDDRCH